MKILSFLEESPCLPNLKHHKNAVATSTMTCLTTSSLELRMSLYNEACQPHTMVPTGKHLLAFAEWFVGTTTALQFPPCSECGCSCGKRLYLQRNSAPTPIKEHDWRANSPPSNQPASLRSNGDAFPNERDAFPDDGSTFTDAPEASQPLESTVRTESRAILVGHVA
jgi:hypothetical protein